MSKASQVIILAEDRRQQTFIQRFLERAGYKGRIRPESLPAGKGSGEAWVRQRYVKNVAAYRTRAARAATALVVALDADTYEVIQRANQLANALREANLPARGGVEKIVHVIPKHNIETWIRCLNNLNANEDEDYKHRHDIDVDALIKPAAIAFFDGSRQYPDPPAHWINSLRLAIREVRRLDE